MTCPHCSSLKIANRTFNERTLTPFNSIRVQITTLFKVVLWRLRYKLSLSLTDLAEMFRVEVNGFYFVRETTRR